MSKSILRDAVLETDTIKKWALATAKQSLEENITPSISSLISKQLNEISDDELDEMIRETDEQELDEDFDLESFIAEVDEEEADEFGEPEGEEDIDVTADVDVAPEDGDVTGGPDGSLKLSDITVAELTDLIADVLRNVGNAGMETDVEPSVDDAELDSLDGPDMETADDDLNLEAILQEIEDQVEEAEVKESNTITELRSQLKEAHKTLNHITKKLVEVNSLNARLVFTNKLFKQFPLSEAQKVSVIQNLDKANTVKEAELVYESLKKTYSKTASAKKTLVKEALGFASKASGVSPNKAVAPIVDNTLTERWKKIAGI